MRTIVVFVFIGIVNFTLFSQEQRWKESIIDSITYQLYSTGKFKSLIQEGTSAVQHDVDFYYLRLRLGEAYYYDRQPLLALVHFKKALEFQPSDVYTKKWLVEVYSFLGWAEEAKTLLATLDVTTQQLNAYKIGKEKLINIEAGVQIPSFTSSQETTQEYVEKNKMDAIYYQQIGCKFPISNRVNIYTGFSAIQNQRTQNFSYKEHLYTNGYSYQPNVLENATLNTILNRYENSSLKSTNVNQSFNSNLQQYHAYVGASILLPNDWRMQVGLNYFTITQRLTSASYQGIVFMDSTTTDPYLYRYKTKYSFNAAESTNSNGISTISLSKVIGKWVPQLNVTVGTIASTTISQFGGILSYAPLGNQSLNFALGFTQLHDTENRNVILGKVTGKITDRWWYESTVHIGDLTNYSEGNGYVVYNVSDKITSKIGANLTYFFSSRLALSIRYDWMQRQYPVLTSNNGSFTVNDEKYTNHSFLTSLLWKF